MGVYEKEVVIHEEHREKVLWTPNQYTRRKETEMKQ